MTTPQTQPTAAPLRAQDVAARRGQCITVQVLEYVDDETFERRSATAYGWRDALDAARDFIADHDIDVTDRFATRVLRLERG